MAVNLLAALDDERYGGGALARAHEAAAGAGYALRRVDGADGLLAAWIDYHFAPSWWSYEAGAGSAWVAERDGAIAGFAAFGARGLRFPWLRRWRDRADVGVFGPFPDPDRPLKPCFDLGSDDRERIDETGAVDAERDPSFRGDLMLRRRALLDLRRAARQGRPHPGTPLAGPLTALSGGWD